MSNKHKRNYWLNQSTSATDLISMADDWRMIAAVLAEAIRISHLSALTDECSCLLCDAYDRYKEARRG